MKKIITLFAAVAMLCSVAFTNAATSNANIVFTPGGGETLPVNPENPSQPGPGEPVDGSFIIVKVTDFEFGAGKVGVAAVDQATGTVQPNIQTLDLRGTSKGWHILAQMSEFTDETAAETLPGADILIKDGRPNSEYETTLTAPVNEKDVVLSAGSDQPVKVLSADEGAGLGLWVMRWYDAGGANQVFLRIPIGQSTAGTHTATITWSLIDGP